MSLLTIHNLSKAFSANEGRVVNHASFSVADEEIFALLGPSGCGKTTILRLIGGFERPDAGTISLNNQVLTNETTWVRPEKRGIGFVFQEYALFPHLNVLQNVMFGIGFLPKAEREACAMEMLKRVGLERFPHRKPHELSGGQQQRVALARAMAPAPKLILLDEPFSNLDAVLRLETREELRALLKQYQMSAILVTHDQEEAFTFADRVAVMQSGRIEQIGTPEELYYLPRTLFVAQFLGKTNLVFSKAHGTEAQSPMGTLRLNKPAEGQVLLAIRPEHLDLTLAPEAEHAAEIIGRDFKGHDITYHLRQNGFQFLAHTDNRHRFEVGDRVTVCPVEPAVVLEKATA